jgi:hydroxyacid-oxoacid transhydrogenase
LNQILILNRNKYVLNPLPGLNKSYTHPGYEHCGKPIVPHGVSVAIPAPAVFRFTASACPERHLEAARILGADVTNGKSSGSYAGGALAEQLMLLMAELDVPLSLRQLGFGSEDVEELVKGTLPQKRVTQLSPHGSPDEDALAMIFEACM